MMIGQRKIGVLMGGLSAERDISIRSGEAVVAARDATGLNNPSVWAALERKGLIRPQLPQAVILTELGQQYETGLRERILHTAGH